MPTREAIFPILSRLKGWLPSWGGEAPALPTERCRILMAETVDDYTPLGYQNALYEVDFDPAKLSPDGDFYRFAPGEVRIDGWRPLKRRHCDEGYYFVAHLDCEEHDGCA